MVERSASGRNVSPPSVHIAPFSLHCCFQAVMQSVEILTSLLYNVQFMEVISSV